MRSKDNIMQKISIQDFTRIINAFSSAPESSYIGDGKITTEINDDQVIADYITDGNYVTQVKENFRNYNTIEWIELRLARLDLLADRIISYTAHEPHYVEPSGKITSASDQNVDSDTLIPEVGTYLYENLKDSQDETRVIYLTSDAGEGKSTIIRQTALRSARAYKSRENHTLVLPIILGGTTFLRFDHVMIGTLSKIYRFNRYYYDGIIELIKLGLIIPALDGFEEMFIESHSGEAVSSLGLLIQSLESSGSIIVAARKAFFEFTNLRTQAVLFDSIRDYNVSFSRVKINNWSETQFINFAKSKGHENPDELYKITANRIGVTNPILRRAYLAQKYISNNSTLKQAEDFITNFSGDISSFTFKFSEILIQREILSTWYDKTGDVTTPLLTLSDHHDLLGDIAQEMWVSSSTSLRPDVVDVIVELFCEARNIRKSKSRQIKERVKNHALLTSSIAQSGYIEFDHDEMRLIYLGRTLGNCIAKQYTTSFVSIAQVDRIPSEAVNYAAQTITNRNSKEHLIFLQKVALLAGKSSYTNTNTTSLMLKIHNTNKSESRLMISNSSIFIEENDFHQLYNIIFSSCYFEELNISNAFVSKVQFEQCDIDRIVINEQTDLSTARFNNSKIREVFILSPVDSHSIYEPQKIQEFLTARTEKNTDCLEDATLSEDLFLFDRFLRLFIRTTEINTDSIEFKLGKSYKKFQDEIIPKLIKNNIIEEVKYRGRGNQKRYKLLITFSDAKDILYNGVQDLDGFITFFKKLI